jgi:histone-lysine N-methyltransferase SUV420H
MHHRSPIEIGRTSRYSHVTGKSELGVFATFDMKQRGVGLLHYISGDLAPFSDTDSAGDSDLHQTGDLLAAGVQLEVAKRDFSVVLSARLKAECVFLGTARFVNVSGRS